MNGRLRFSSGGERKWKQVGELVIPGTEKEEEHHHHQREEGVTVNQVGPEWGREEGAGGQCC